MSATLSASIVIAARNEGANVRRTVQGLLEVPAGAEFEIVLIDDGNDDGSFDFLREEPFASDARLRSRRFEDSAGCIVARHEGATMARGEQLLFLDAHVSAPPGWLAELSAAVERWGPKSAISPDIAGLDVERWTAHPSSGKALGIDEKLDFVWRSGAYPNRLVPTVLGCFMIMRRDFYFEIGGFDLGIRQWGCEFIDLILKVYAAGGVCYYEGSPVVGHLFRQSFPYPMRFREIVYNKLRTGFVHFTDEAFARLAKRLEGEHGFAEAMADFKADREALLAGRDAQRRAQRRHPDWFVRTFLPGLAEDSHGPSPPGGYNPPQTPSPPSQAYRTRDSAMKIPVTHRQMELFAQNLRSARANGAIPPRDYQSLHANFRAVDSHYRVWTFSLKGRQWHRLAAGRWVAQEPRGELRIEERILRKLESLRTGKPSAQRKPRPGPTWNGGNIAPARMEALARALAEACRSGAIRRDQYAALHRRFTAFDAEGTKWTYGLSSRKWHRARGGRWVPAIPPGKLSIDGALMREIDLLPAGPAPHKKEPPRRDPELTSELPRPKSLQATPPPKPAPAKCSQCGAPVREGKKFCGECGKPYAPPPKAAAPRPAKPAGPAKCPNNRCGRTIPAGKKFCPACGTFVG